MADSDIIYINGLRVGVLSNQISQRTIQKARGAISNLKFGASGALLKAIKAADKPLTDLENCISLTRAPDELLKQRVSQAMLAIVMALDSNLKSSKQKNQVKVKPKKKTPARTKNQKNRQASLSALSNKEMCFLLAVESEKTEIAALSLSFVWQERSGEIKSPANKPIDIYEQKEDDIVVMVIQGTFSEKHIKEIMSLGKYERPGTIHIVESTVAMIKEQIKRNPKVAIDFHILRKEDVPRSRRSLITALQWANKTHDSSEVLEKLKGRYNPNAKDSDGMSALMYAIWGCHSDVIDILIKDGADLNAAENKFGQTALMMAAERNQPHYVKKLLDSGADFSLKSSSGYTALDLALQKKNQRNYHDDSLEDVITSLKEMAETPEARENRIKLQKIIKALKAESYSEVNKLISEDIDASGEYGCEALHNAVSKGQIEFVERLIDAGADVDMKSEDGQTPLFRAAENGHEAIGRLILRAGANINATGKYAMSPLEIAVKREQAEVVRMLLESGNIHKKDKDWALGEAISSGSQYIEKTLREFGAEE